MGTPAQTGTITTSGSAGGVTLQIVSPDTEGIVVISGAYTGLTLYFDASRDAAPQSVFFPILAIRMSDLASQVSTPSGVAVSPDGQTLSWRIPSIEGCTALRVWAYALTSGPVNVQIASGSFFASNPVTSSVGAGLTTTQLLFALEDIRNLLMWQKEPYGTTPPVLVGGSLLKYLGYPAQAP